jgi:hypothetical protein
MEDHDEAVITWDFGGTGEIDRSMQNPPARALRRLLGDGKPGDRIMPFTVCDPTTGRLRWLGAFVHSSAGRIIFFPDRPSKVRARNEVVQAGLDVDHLTLERDLQTWHLTSNRSSKHESAGKTVKQPGDAVGWFGMTLQSLDQLMEVGRQVIIRAEIPPTDADRRMGLFKNAIEGLRFPEFQGLPRSTALDDLPHFAVYVSRRPIDRPPTNPLLPCGGPYHVPSVQRDEIRPGKLLAFNIGELHFQAIFGWLSGKLLYPIAFTTGR